MALWIAVLKVVRRIKGNGKLLASFRHILKIKNKKYDYHLKKKHTLVVPVEFMYR